MRHLRSTCFQSIRNELDTLDPRIILIGDATHGTQEFYDIRCELTRSLIQNTGVAAVICEGDVGRFCHVNRHVTKDSLGQDMKTMLPLCHDSRFPAWMWCNDSMQEFVSWLQEYNSNDDHTKPTFLLGMDIFGIFESIKGVVEYVQKYAENEHQVVSAYYKTLQSFDDPKAYGKAVADNLVESQEHNVRNVVKILGRHGKKLQRHDAFFKAQQQEQELFYAIQNARAVDAAERHFRLLMNHRDEQKNVVEIWNLRDEAFIHNIQETAAFLRQKENNTGRTVVVWAHNSHVGNVEAMDYAPRGYTNLCQLCRQAFGNNNVYSIGMTAYEGTVRASSEWGGPDKAMKLTPAFEGSHEYLLHVIAKNHRESGIGVSLTGSRMQRMTAAQELFHTERVERFVGASYTPETELQSHYNVCNLSRQFDFVIQVDQTTALRVDSVRRVV